MTLHGSADKVTCTGTQTDLRETTLTKLRDLAERLFAELAGYPLADWIADRRDQGKSWRQIERDLRDEYDIELTNVTLLAWYGAATSDAA